MRVDHDESAERLPAPLHIHLLGPFALRLHGQEIHRLSRPARSLLALLTLHQHAPLSRDRLADLLWPEATHERALFYLRRCLSELRTAFGPQRERLSSPARGTILLDLSDAWCDVLAFDAAVAQNEVSALEEAVALYRGPLLEGTAEAWAIAESETRAEHYIGALETLAGCRERTGDLTKAVAYLRRILEADFLREPVHQRLMEALAGMGDYAGVERQYRELRHALHSELHLEPSEATKALYRCLKQEARLPSGSASSAPGSAPSFEVPFDNLPRPLGPLIGRDTESKALVLRLRETRLLTLTGIGGIGKTRLAMAVADSLRATFAQGVVWVELANLTSPAQIARQIAVCLQLSERPGLSDLQILTDYLRSRTLLLVLDNCEHLLGACAEVARALLHASAGLKILATSRQSLGLFGEDVWRVSPLSVPDSDSEALIRVEESEAARLFATRARAVRQEFRLTGANAAAVARVCRQLEGIPLALELAAVWVRLLSPEQIVHRLSDQFALLQGGDRVADSRHQTLQNTMDWSYTLLEPEERALLAHLSVFTGGWTLEAVEAICFAQEDDRAQALPRLRSLAEKSLVEIEARDDRPRYRLLEPVRQYAQARLTEREEAANVRQRHAAYFLEMAEQCTRWTEGPRIFESLERMAADYENCREALHFCLRHAADPSYGRRGVRMAIALHPYQRLRGYYQEALETVEGALRSCPCHEDFILRAEALQCAGMITMRMGNEERTLAFATEAKALYDRLPVCSGLLLVLRQIAGEDLIHERYEAAHLRFNEALRLSREIGDRDNEARMELSLGILAKFQGDRDRAEQRLEAAIQRFQAAHLLPDEGVAQHNLANILREDGRWQQARPHYLRSLEIHRQLDSRPWIGINLVELGSLAMLEGDLAEARRQAEQALDYCRKGDRTIEPQCLHLLGGIERLEGDPAAAHSLHSEAIRLQAQLSLKRDLTYSLWGMGKLLEAVGQWERTVQLLAAILSIRAAMKAPFTEGDQEDMEQQFRRCREALGEEVFRSAWQAGERLSLEETVALAIRPLEASL